MHFHLSCIVLRLHTRALLLLRAARLATFKSNLVLKPCCQPLYWRNVKSTNNVEKNWQLFTMKRLLNCTGFGATYVFHLKIK